MNRSGPNWNQRLNCLVRLRNFYKNNAHVQRLDNAMLVNNSEHLFRLIERASNVNVGLLKSIVTLPACSQRTHFRFFCRRLLKQNAILEKLQANTESVGIQFTTDLLYGLFTDNRKKRFCRWSLTWKVCFQTRMESRRLTALCGST